MDLGAQHASPRWIDLPELLDHVAAHLSPNDVACTLKLINKATEKHLKSYSQVKLSQPVPQHAFTWRWGEPDSTRDMTLGQREHFLALTARSGVLANLQLAHLAAGCPVNGYDSLGNAGSSGSLELCQWLINTVACSVHQTQAMIESAAEDGHFHIVRWLLQQEQQRQNEADIECLAQGALIVAARTGQRAFCEELLADGTRVPCKAVYAAFERGHAAIGAWLLDKCELPDDDEAHQDVLVSSAVYGLDLPSLQRVCSSLFSSRRFSPNGRLVSRAMFSPTPDWRDKVTWLEQQAGSGVVQMRPEDFANDFASDVAVLLKEDCPDALERVQLVGERGGLAYREFVNPLIFTAGRNRNLHVMQYLQDNNAMRFGAYYAVWQAVHEGNLNLLVELNALGCRLKESDAQTAAENGHLHVLQWMAGPEAGLEGVEALRQKEAQLTYFAALSGSVEVMRWLRERGFSWAATTFEAAIDSGSVPLLEMLAAEGCPMQGTEHLMEYACNGDLLTLTCLRQLGWPWVPAGKAFVRAIWHGCSPQQLQRLLDMGCPVDWQRARRAALMARAEGVRLWVEAQMYAA